MEHGVRSFFGKYYVMIVLLFCFVVGFAVSDHYGTYWDQDMERSILMSNVKSYSNASETIASYTELYFLDFPNVQPIEETVERDHGMAIYLPMFPMLIQRGLDMGYYKTVQHIYTFLVFFLGVIALYYLAKEVTKSKKYGLLVSMLYYTAPRFFAEGHYNNKDMMLLSLMLITYSMGYACVKKPKIIRCILFALAGAFTINMKIPGAIAPGIMGVIFILSIFKKEGKRYRIERMDKAIVTFALLIAFYYLLTPAMWLDVRAYFEYLFANAVQFSRWDGLIFFNGEIYQHSRTGLPSIYLFRQYFLTTPLLITILALIGVVYMFVDIIHRKTRKEFWKKSENIMIFAGTISSFFLMLYAALSGAVVYNSWRHFYFCFTGVLFAIIFLFKKIEEEEFFVPKGKQIGIALFSIYFVLTIGGLIMNHPHQYAYFNIAAGTDVQERYEIDYWCVSYEDILTDLVEFNFDEKTEVRTFDYVSGQPLYTTYVTLPNETQEYLEILPLDSDLQYGTLVLDNLTYSASMATDAYSAVRNEQELIYELKSYGNTLVRVYRVSN